MFGLEVNATNFNKGKIVIYSGEVNGSYETVLSNGGYAYTLTPEKPNLDMILELTNMPWPDYSWYPYINDLELLQSVIKGWECGDAIFIDYINDSGRTIRLVQQNLSTQRMKKYKINIDVEALVDEVEDNIKPNVVEDKWDEEDIEF